MLGNCYYLASVSACAEEPKRIRDRLLVKKVNKAGIYLVTLFVNGVVTPVIVDDWFPVVDDKPAFCSSESGEIWGMLFEKAWAKLHGSYQRTEGGECYHAVQHITGMPTKTFNHSSQKDIGAFFALLKKFDSNHCTMLSSSISG